MQPSTLYTLAPSLTATDYFISRLRQDLDDPGTARRHSVNLDGPAGNFENDPMLLAEATELRSMGKEAPPASLSDTNREEVEDGNEPTEHEKRNLRHIGESLPFAAWLVASVELCERAAFYGCQGLFQVRLSMLPNAGSDQPTELHPAST